MKIYVFERGFLKIILPKAVKVDEFDLSNFYFGVKKILRRFFIDFNNNLT
jgi:hypothetical protein